MLLFHCDRAMAAVCMCVAGKPKRRRGEERKGEEMAVGVSGIMNTGQAEHLFKEIGSGDSNTREVHFTLGESWGKNDMGERRRTESTAGRAARGGYMAIRCTNESGDVAAYCNHLL